MKVCGIIILILLCNVSFGFCAGPACSITINNVTGEDLYIEVKYSSEVSMDSYRGEAFIYNRDLEKPTLMSGDLRHNRINWKNKFSQTILWIPDAYSEDELIDIINRYILEINIYNRNRKKILTMENILKNGIDSFVPALHGEALDSELYWWGTYNIHILRSDIIQQYDSKRNKNNSPSHFTTEKLNVRASDNINSKIITVLKKGQELAAIQVGDFEEENKDRESFYWIKVRTEEGLVGWCSALYLEPK